MASSIITNVVTGGANNHATVASEANSYATDFVAQGILGSFTNTNGGAPTTGSFGVNADASPDMGITIKGSGNTGSGAAVAYVIVTPATQDKQILRARMTADYTGYTINSNSTGSTVYDWIYLQGNATNANVPSASADNVINLYTSRSTSNVTDNGTPPTYGILLAVVTVANGASSITNANIADMRTQASLSSLTSGGSAGWTALGYPLTYNANNGNKEFLATASVDLTGILSPGMRLKVNRAVNPPTQAMSFTAASSQYATKASPSGVTFTGPFTCEAWIYLNSYTGQAQTIVNRFDAAATSGGWKFIVLSTGQLQLLYGTGSNFTDFETYQSVPLNRWVHVAGAVTSVSSKTGAIYINGTSVPITSVLTASTTLTQASTDLRLGAASATPANTYFNGYMSEIRIWSTGQTQSSIQANMTKSLVGNESNLVGLWQGNGNFNDSTSNSNNLTANGGAIATQISNPYNTTEFGTIIAISYSNPTTTITVDTGNQNTLPNMTLNNASYSVDRLPFGFPANLTKYRREILLAVNTTTTSSTPVQINGLTQTLTIPTGVSTITITLNGRTFYNNTNATAATISLWDGGVNSGTQLANIISQTATATGVSPVILIYRGTPVSGSKTYNIGLTAPAGTSTVEALTTAPLNYTIECDL